MIFVNHIRNAKAAKDYYSQHLAPGDYYGKDRAELPGVWHGRGAELLGLSGEVAQREYFRLCDNADPRSGKQLTQRMVGDRRVLTDFTFDAPKSVTLAYEMGGHDGVGDESVFEAFRNSVRETMAEMERDAKTRVRKNGADRDRATGNMVWAEHMHRTTRPVDGKPDPQLHCHATVFNATYDETETRWKAIQLGDIVRDKGYYQAAFHARLAAKLKALGYGIEKQGNSFEIAGIGKAARDKFSNRTGVIEKEAKKRGIADAKEKGELGRKTREKKSEAPQSIAELRREWDSRLSDEERLAIRTVGCGYEHGDREIASEEAKAYALEHSFQNASAVSEKRLKAEALKYAVGSITPEDVADIARHPEVIAEMRGGQFMTTTKSVLRDEVSMLRFAKDGQRKFQPLIAGLESRLRFNLLADESSGSGLSDESRFKKAEGAWKSLAGLSQEQKKAALHLLNSRDQVTGVVGRAGTGKTTMMRAARDAVEGETGLRVFAFAPSAQASRGVLASEGFKDATTLETLLKSQKLQEQAKGQVIWVDEAGQVSSRDMKRLMDVVKKGDNRLILTGDYKQHASVEAGDAFRLLEKEAGVKLARLTEVRRQKTPAYRKAVEAISQGTGKAAQKGFDALDRMGDVVEVAGEDRHRILVKDYLTAQEEGRTGLIIAPTHAEGNRLTQELRETLKERGVIGQERRFTARDGTGWSNAEKGDIRNYQAGLVVEFHQNAKGFTRGEKALATQGGEGLVLQKQDGTKAALPLDKPDRFAVYRPQEIAIGKGDRIRITKNGEAKVRGQAKGTSVNNGDIYTVEGFTPEGDIRIGRGKVLPGNWGHLTYGYVDTSYASQGKTVDRVFIAAGKESLPAADQQQWYVSVTRGREMARVYVEDKAEMRQAVARTGERLSAVELTGTKIERPLWRQRFQEALERGRAYFRKQRQMAQEYGRGKEGMSYG